MSTEAGAQETPLAEAASLAEAARLATENAVLRAQLAAAQHRARNALAVIRSVARRSAETSESVEEYATHLDGRINAFARVQGALLRDPEQGVALEALVSDALLQALAREGERWTMSGPAVVLAAKAAELMGLALHELATNAVKFGALSWPRGQIAVTWRLAEAEGDAGGAEAPGLTFAWTETGAPAPAGPARRGFGTEILERTLAYQLGARTALEFLPQGLAYRVDLPPGAGCRPREASAGP